MIILILTNIVEAGDGSADASMILKTTLHSSIDSSTLYLRDLHLERPLKVAGGDEGEAGG